MSLSLYEQVALRRDMHEYGLRKGDVATLVDYVPHPSGKEKGCVLEVFNAVGESMRVIVVAETDIEPLEADEVFTIRRLVHAA
jgi:hypothetical protein